jgi:hypothetical protein
MHLEVFLSMIKGVDGANRAPFDGTAHGPMKSTLRNWSKRELTIAARSHSLPSLTLASLPRSHLPAVAVVSAAVVVVAAAAVPVSAAVVVVAAAAVPVAAASVVVPAAAVVVVAAAAVIAVSLDLGGLDSRDGLLSREGKSAVNR